MSVLSRTFAERLTEAVETDHRNLSEIAQHSGYHRNYIRRLMTGVQANPTIGFVEVMALTLQRDPRWLLGLA